MCVNAQHEIDSLNQLLKSAIGSERVQVLIDLAKRYNQIDPEQSLKYSDEGELLARKLMDANSVGQLVNAKGVSYYYLNEIQLSNENYLLALEIFDSIEYKTGVAQVLNNIGWNYKVQENYEEAVNYFEQSYRIALEGDDQNLVQGILNNLGTGYRHLARNDEALEVFKESLEINKETENTRWEAYNLNNIGLIYMDKKQYELSLEHFELAKAINLEQGFIQELTRNILNIGRLYGDQRDFVKAHQYLDKADSIIERINYRRGKLEYFGYKTFLNEEAGNYKEALRYDRQYQALNIELNQAAWNEKISEMKNRLELEQKERELEASERKIGQQQFIILGGSAVFLLLLGILFLLYKLYRSKHSFANSVGKLNDEIKEKNERLSEMNEEIRGINDNLEQIVKERTDKIQYQNDKLMKYAFINSHEIRGPLARVLGLMYLIGLEKKIANGDRSFELLNDATNELDEIIKRTSKLLQDEEFFAESEERH